MSQLLDQLARTDAQRSADLDRTDAEMARINADIAEDVRKAQRRSAVNDAEAFRLQLQQAR